ncbi:hypothetical protein LIER_41478 [Lithospermum erythrorhizon]|uniref:Uncharacterized protein n=1 Tax=Lithospermum erythrorhizon TaxID=34254 RepID=A0AAV3RCX5_LITER
MISTRFEDILGINKVSGIPEYFLKWVSKIFNSDLMHILLSKNEVLPILLEDAERIYNLPSSGYEVDVKKCNMESIAKLWKEFGMSEKEEELVTYEEMKDMMSNLQDDTSWCKAIIIYMFGFLLCPNNFGGVSLK